MQNKKEDQSEKDVGASITPWLSVNNGEKAVAFYKEAFDAVEVYRLEDAGENIVVRLSVHGAEFWISGEGNGNGESVLVGNSVRMILTVSNPDEVFEKALKAGATEIFPLGEDHGWRLGRLADPFGLHWEIGKPV
jgi:PhnB protein